MSKQCAGFIAALTTLLSLAGAFAQTGGKMPDYYKEPGLYPNRDYTNQHFGEHIDPFTGALQLHYTDIFIPGAGGFNLTVQRSYNSSVVDKSQPKANSMMGVGWAMHYGRVTKAGTGGICTNDDWDTSTDNPVIEMPDGSVQRMHFVASGTPLALTTRRWKVECAPAATPGLIVTSTDGTQYLMTKQISEGGFSGTVNAYYTTKITDRNGNYANVAYSNNTAAAEITSITANDSRTITFTYYDSGTAWRRVNSIAGPSGTWYYNYTAAPGLVNTYQLTGVTRPVTGNWAYSYNGNLQPSAGSYQMSSLTMPQGGSITYGYTNVSVDSSSGTSVSMISSKSAGSLWSWSYSPATTMGAKDSTTVSTPSGSITYKHWGPNGIGSGDVWKIGLLTDKAIGSVQSESYTWDKILLVDEPNTREGVFSSKSDADTYQPVLTGKTITRNGASHVTTYSSFDSYGNPASISESGPNGGSRSTSATYFNSIGKWIIGFIKDESRTGGQNVSRSYDGNGNPTQVCRDSVCYGYSYNSDGTMSRMTNPRDFDTTYGSYYRGIPQSESRPAGVSVSRIVSGAGNVTSESIGGQSFGYGYDAINRVSSITYPAGSGVAIGYGSASRTATRGTLSEVTSYNGYGYVTGVSLGGIATAYTVDALGRRKSESNPGGSDTIDYTYDILNRLTSVTNQDGSSRSIGYGSASATVSDERSNNTTYSYRSYGDPNFQALVGISSPLQGTTINRNDRDLISGVVQGSKTRGYGYNSNYYLTSITEPETGTTTYGRDLMGNMTSRKVGGSGITNYVYDGLDRMTSVTYPGAIAINKTYNGRGRLLTVTGAPGGDRTYTYDGNDNLATETLSIDDKTLVATYGYNGLDQLDSITYPKTGRTVTYSPNNLGRPTQASPYVTAVSYHNSGQINTITYANGATTAYGQNNRLWPSSFTASKSTGFISSTYGYDGAGNLTSINDSIDNGLDRTLGYDSINRLTSASGPWGSGSFNYDGAGNVQTRTLGTSTTTYSYDGSNRLSSVSGGRTATMTYGAYGAVTGDGSNVYEYDSVPNMMCTNCLGDFPVYFRYDGTNTRTSRDNAMFVQPTYEFTNARGQLLLEYSPANNDLTIEHIYLGDKRVAQRSNDTTIPKIATTTTLTVNPTSTSCGSNTTLTATVSPLAATGTVQFLDAGTPIGTATLSNGVATLATQLPRPGSRTITAQYQGSATHESGVSNGVAATVTSVANSISLSYSPAAPYSPGNPITITATVNGCVQGNGQITFRTSAAGSISSIPTATVQLTGRSASTTFTAGYGRNYSFRATLTGDGIATNNIYADGSFDVIWSSSVTITGANPNPVTQQQYTTFSAMVTGNQPVGQYSLAGNVNFYAGATLLGSGYFDGTNPATLYTPLASANLGNIPITAVYTGDGYHYPSPVSAPYNLIVGTPTTTTVSATPNSLTYGQTTALTATVTSSVGTPTGTVSFYDGATLLGSATLSGNSATLNNVALVAGTRSIKAVYAGSGSIVGSTSTTITVTVAKATPVVTITSINPSPGTAFGSINVSATITASPTPPTQAGLLLIDGGVIDIMNPGAGSMTRTTNRIPTGVHQVVARYTGNANYNQADSAPVSLSMTGHACNLDVNRSTAFDDPDGRAILAWLLGFRGTSLYDAAQYSNGVDAPGIMAFVKPQVDDLTLDLDGDGVVLPATDGLMLLRLSLGLSGTAVTQNAINLAGTRPDWASVRNYLNTTCGMSLQ